jgi:Sigma-70, region 4
LETLVTRYSECLSTLSPQTARLLVLRAGVGVGRAYTAEQVARALNISLGRETHIERAGLAQLQSAGQSGRCGSSFVVLHVPNQDQLVPVSPVFVSAVRASASHAPSRSGAPVARRVSAAERARSSSSGPGIQNTRLHLAKASTPVLPFVVGGLGLLAVLAFLSTAGRRLAAKEQALLAGTDAGAASSALFVPAPVPTADSDASDQASVAPGGAAALIETDTERLPDTPGSGSSPEPTAPAFVSSEAQDQAWLRTHRSQIALVLTAVAGGTLRTLRRRRR